MKTLITPLLAATLLSCGTTPTQPPPIPDPPPLASKPDPDPIPEPPKPDPPPQKAAPILPDPISPEPASLSLSTTQGIFQSTHPATLLLQARYVTEARLSARSLSRNDLFKIFLAGHDLSQLRRPFRRSRFNIWPEPTPLPDLKGKRTIRDIAFSPGGAVIDVAEIMGKPTGAIMIEAEPINVDSEYGFSPHPQTRGIYQVTDLMVELLPAHPKSLVRVIRLSTGKPVKGARVEQWFESSTIKVLGKTNADGLIPLPSVRQRAKSAIRTAFWVQKDKDHMLLSMPGFGAPKSRRLNAPFLKTGEQVGGRLISERGVYRPGERVHVVGWLHVATPSGRFGLRRIPVGTRAKLELNDGERTVSTLQTTVTPTGKVMATFDLPKDARLGRWGVSLKFKGQTRSGFGLGFEVKTFRTPEFQTRIDPINPPFVVGDDFKFSAEGRYTFGSPIEITEARGSVSCTSKNIQIPALEGWHIARAIRPWRSGRRTSTRLDLTPQTDSPQTLDMTLPASALGDKPIYSEELRRCRLNMTLRDNAFQEATAETHFSVYPSRHFLALKPPARVMEGQRVVFPIRAVDHQGKRIEAKGVSVKIERRWGDPTFAYRSKLKVVDRIAHKSDVVARCELDLLAQGNDSVCVLPTAEHGTYTVRLNHDDSRAQTIFMFSPSPSSWQPHMSYQGARLKIRTSPKKPKPGDTLTVEIISAFKEGRGILFGADGFGALPFELKGGRAEFKIKIKEEWAPKIRLGAHMTLSSQHDHQLPRAITVWSSIPIDLDHLNIKVDINAPKTARPGQKVPVSVRATDHKGRPVRGRLALWATEETLLTLTGYAPPDLAPSVAWSRVKAGGFNSRNGFGGLIRPHKTTLERGGYNMKIGGKAGDNLTGPMPSRLGEMSNIPPRENFVPTPLFLGDIALDARGRATVSLTLPDGLTTYRITAIASAPLSDGITPGRFGSGESKVRVETPLVIRPILPNLLRMGDSAELAAIVHNGGAAGKLTVLAEFEDDRGILALESPASVEVDIEAGGQARIPYQVRAKGLGALKIGFRAAFEPKDAAQKASFDAVRMPLKVEPIKIEHIELVGQSTAEGEVRIPLPALADPIKDFGGLTLSVSSTMLEGLEGAVQKIIQYPYGCAEQTSTRLLPLVALNALSKHRSLDIDTADTLVRAGIKRLLSMQTSDGGFAYWPGRTVSNGFVSGYVFWVLQMADAAGYKIPRKALQRASAYIWTLASVQSRDDTISLSNPDAIRSAMAIHALAQDGKFPDGAIDRLLEVPDLPAFAHAFVLMALHAQDPTDPRLAAVTQTLLDKIQVKDNVAFVVTPEGDYSAYFHSEVRDTAIVLMALIETDPDNPLLPKIAKGLMERRRNGAWRNTQENAFALLALSAFASAHEHPKPAFTVQALINGEQIFKETLRGPHARPQSGVVSMARLMGLEDSVSGSAKEVVLRKKGIGKVYYRAVLTYTPSIQGPDTAVSHGMSLERELRDRDSLLEPTDPIAPGTIVAMDLIVKSDRDTTYVALNAPIPAGLEPINLDLGRGTAQSMPLTGYKSRRTSHIELHNDRALLFFDHLPRGDTRHTVFLRATTLGTFEMPPARVEAMYAPEISGRTASRTLSVRPSATSP